MSSVYSPRQLGGHRYVGDKRKGIVYDLQDVLPEDVFPDGGDVPDSPSEAETPAGLPADAAPARGMSPAGVSRAGMSSSAGVPRVVIDELLASEQYLCFAPDTLSEALNRGYRQSRRSARGFMARLSGRRLPHSLRRASSLRLL